MTTDTIATREHLFSQLDSAIGNTPLTRLDGLYRRTGSQVFVKHEYLNPTGSHYDRLMLHLLRQREQAGVIAPGRSHLLDVTSGNSGASLAWLSRVLGYECTIIMPEDMPTMRHRQIESFGAHLVLSPKGRYVAGAIEYMKEQMRIGFRSKEGYHLINHAADLVAVPEAMETLGTEMVADLERQGIESLDFAVAALGNGSSLTAFEPLRCRLSASIIGFEPAESPRMFVERYGEDTYHEERGERPTYSANHGLIGTGPGETKFGWPLLDLSISTLGSIVTVSRQEWECAAVPMAFEELLHCGRTTAAAYHVASLLTAERPSSSGLMIAYDPAWKYF